MSKVDEAFSKIKREDFLPATQKPNANFDMALPIGYGQTNSQPYTVRKMLNWLDVKVGQKILDVGSGSGWTTALLSYLVGEKGKVYAVELVPELVDFGRENCLITGVKNVDFFQAREIFGLPRYAPYDRILVSAAADNLPNELIDQLKESGKIVIPINNDILEITKLENGNLKSISHPGFMFVPLIQNN